MSESLPVYPNLLDRDDLVVQVHDVGGSRGRAAAWKLRQSPLVSEVLLSTGNADDGIRFAVQHEVDLVVPCSEDMLAEGLVDQLAARGIAAYGPTRRAARLEAWKPYAKHRMVEAGIPTTDFQVFKSPKRAHAYLDKRGYGVLKAAGLARGKGVLVCIDDLQEGHTFIEDVMVRRIFGNAGHRLVIEDPAEGEEFSMHAVVGIGADGQILYKPFISSQDHKQINDGDTGANTGGVGMIAPVSWLPQSKINSLSEAYVKPILELLQPKGIEYRGVIYPGVKGHHVLEYNVRKGSPEIQGYLRLLKTDFVELMVMTLNNRLDQVELVWEDSHVIDVVACALGYPGSPQTGLEIGGLEYARSYPGVEIFPGSVAEHKGKLYTDGGRILDVTAVGKTPEEARERAYAALGHITFGGSPKNVHYRKDIGLRPAPANF